MTVTEQKQELRRELRKMVEGLTNKYCEQADQAICRSVIHFAGYQEARTVFCYVGTKDEINTVPILKDALRRGKRLCVPKCISRGVMEAFYLDSLESLQIGHYGILEPQKSAVAVPPEVIDLAIIPCLSCGSDGKRLGYGGGYYDRYLLKTKAQRVSLCRGKIMREDIPVDGYDQGMDYVISEKGVMVVRQ